MTEKRLTIKHLDSRIRALSKKLTNEICDINVRQDDLRKRLDGLEYREGDGAQAERVNILRSRIKQMEEGLGGTMWRTQQGHARWLAILTTPHLENIQKGGFARGPTATLVAEELGRRATDRDFRSGQRESMFPARSCRRAGLEEKMVVLGVRVRGSRISLCRRIGLAFRALVAKV